MRSPNIDELALRIVPGAGPVTTRFLSTGLFNTTYRVVRDGAEYALRIPAGEVAMHQDRDWEIRVLRQAHAAGLAPPLRYAAVENGVLLFAWMTGSTWSEQGAREPDAVSKVAALLRAVHAMAIPKPARTMSPADWIDAYSRALSAGGLGRALPFAPRAMLGLERLRALPSAPGVLCHSDLHRLNVLRREPSNESKGLLLLDWEYAHVGDAHWDLAGWSANNDLDDRAQRALVSSYWGDAPSDAQWRSFKLQYWLYDYICLLWTELYGRLRPGHSATALARAAWLESRLARSACGTITGCPM